MIRYRILFLWLLLFFVAISVCRKSFADQERGDSYRVVYTILDGNGNPVTGQTVSLKVQRVSDDAVLDFSDNRFKFSGWTTKLATMSYQTEGEYYTRTISPDSATNTQTAYVLIVSNDDSTYADQQAELVNFGKTDDLIRIHR